MHALSIPQALGLALRANAEHARSISAQASPAFARLLHLAECSDTGQARYAAHFVAAVYEADSFPFDPFVLRAVDVQQSEDMLLCLDALRWAQADLHRLVPDGEVRTEAVIRHWGLVPVGRRSDRMLALVAVHHS
jgi:hypothetical protein